MISIYYDEDCFMCRNYAFYSSVRLMFDDVLMVNLRDLGSKERAVLAAAAKADLSKGILLKFSGTDVQVASLYRGVRDASGFYYVQGSEAARFIALMSDRQSGLFGLLNSFLKRPILGRLLFPVLRFTRRVILFVTGRSPKFD